MYESITYEVKCHLFNLPRWSLSVVGMDTVKKQLQRSTQSSSNQSSIREAKFYPIKLLLHAVMVGLVYLPDSCLISRVLVSRFWRDSIMRSFIFVSPLEKGEN